MSKSGKYFTLSNVTGSGAAIIVIQLIYLHFSVRKSISAEVRNFSHYRLALSLLARHTNALNILGERLIIGDVNLLDRQRNYVDERKSELRIPISGELDGGFMIVRANRIMGTEQFKPSQIELELDQPPRRVIIFDDGKWNANLLLVKKYEDIKTVLSANQFCCLSNPISISGA